jgi:hypothetical protein
MMNEQARKIFSELLDTNHDFVTIDQAMDSGEQVDIMEWMDLGQKVNKLDREFRNAMGVDAYNEFMRQGRKMFAPADMKAEHESIFG